MFFTEYTEARNAIEHIDGEIARHNHRFLNLYGDYLEVVQGRRALVSRGAFETVEIARQDIIAAASASADAAVGARARTALMRVLPARIGELQGPTSKPLQPTNRTVASSTFDDIVNPARG